jgi:hypothetical protein
LPAPPEEFTNLIFDDEDRAFQQRIALLGPIKDGRVTFSGEQPPPPRDAILSVKLDDVDILHDMVASDMGVVESRCELGEWTTWAQVANNTCYL